MPKLMPDFSDPKEFLGLKIVLVGFGKSGSACLGLLRHFGVKDSQILIFEQDPSKIPANFSCTNTPQEVLHFSPELCLVSPGFPLATDFIVQLRSRSCFVMNEVELGSYFLSSERLVGITGSLGKSTTTAALGAGLKVVDQNTFVGGNLGVPLCSYVLEVLSQKRARAKFVALELSSYHLESLAKIQFQNSIITYLSPNHLERYGSLTEYYQTKFRIARLTRGPLILNKKGGDLEDFFKSQHGLSNQIVWIDSSSYEESKFHGARLLGKHNHDDLALAYAALEELGIPEGLSGLIEFQGLAHRIENLGEVSGVLFINDSKATALESVMTAVHTSLSLPRNGNVHLLIGGKDKGLPWSKLDQDLSHPRLKCYLFGGSRDLIQSQITKRLESFETLHEVLKILPLRILPGDVVLLSPGGASQDQFKNFEERGELFRNFVEQFAKIQFENS